MTEHDAQTMRPHVEAARVRHAAWWTCANTSPVVDMRLDRTDAVHPDHHAGWASEGDDPDIERLVSLQMEAQVNSKVHGGDAIPRIHHTYGARRGAPMSLSHYCGAPVHFKDTTTWTDHCIDDITAFHPEIREENRWYRISRAIVAEQRRQGHGIVQPEIPGIGDVFTNLSVMYGSDRLCLAFIDHAEHMHALRDAMVRDWVRVYDSFAELAGGPGTACWTGWADGRTYPVQCDFSTMISNDMFREFVVPELEFLKDRLTHMVWHLDGVEEFKHLDTLLSLPYIKAIQWSNPPGTRADDERWIPMYQRVQRAGRALLLRGGCDELRRAMDHLQPHGVQLCVWGRATDEYLRDCERYLGARAWE